MSHSLLIFHSLFRAATCLCILAITYLSLAPTEAIVRTGFFPHIEHLAAYAGTSFCVAMGWTNRQTCGYIVIALALYSGLLELMQSFAVGRSPGLWEFCWNIMGIVFGMTLARSLLPMITSFYQK
ncbi:MAG: hypothetical protein ACR2OW_11295 [Methyloligellaceae bacterium]